MIDLNIAFMPVYVLYNLRGVDQTVVVGGGAQLYWKRDSISCFALINYVH